VPEGYTFDNMYYNCKLMRTASVNTLSSTPRLCAASIANLFNTSKLKLNVLTDNNCELTPYHPVHDKMTAAMFEAELLKASGSNVCRA
jgi:hypothetical protein